MLFRHVVELCREISGSLKWFIAKTDSGISEIALTLTKMLRN